MQTGGQVNAITHMQKVLNKYASFDAKAVEKTTPTEARLQPTIADAVKGVLADQKKDSTPTALVPGVTSRDTTVPGAAGSLPATVYTPKGTGPFPVILYFHGGGWVFADRKVYDGGARGLSKKATPPLRGYGFRPGDRVFAMIGADGGYAEYGWR